MLSRMVTVVPLEGNNNSTITQNQTSSNDLNEREAWLSMISLGAVVVIFVLDIFSKVYLAKVATSISRQYSKIMFHKLLRTSLNSLQCFAISDIVNLFVVDLASGIHSHYISQYFLILLFNSRQIFRGLYRGSHIYCFSYFFVGIW